MANTRRIATLNDPAYFAWTSASLGLGLRVWAALAVQWIGFRAVGHYWIGISGLLGMVAAMLHPNDGVAIESLRQAAVQVFIGSMFGISVSWTSFAILGANRQILHSLGLRDHSSADRLLSIGILCAAWALKAFHHGFSQLVHALGASNPAILAGIFAIDAELIAVAMYYVCITALALASPALLVGLILHLFVGVTGVGEMRWPTVVEPALRCIFSILALWMASRVQPDAWERSLYLRSMDVIEQAARERDALQFD